MRSFLFDIDFQFIKIVVYDQKLDKILSFLFISMQPIHFGSLLHIHKIYSIFFYELAFEIFLGFLLHSNDKTMCEYVYS